MRDNYVLAIISRILSNYYRISFAEATTLVENFLLAKGSDFDDADHKRIFRSFIRHIVLEQRNFRSIRHFVLLVDEVLYQERYLLIVDKG